MDMAREKPTILVLASTFPRWKDDTEPRFVFDLCQELKAYFRIIVLAPHCKGARSIEEISGLKIYRYRYAPVSMEVLAYEGGIVSSLRNSKANYLLLPFMLFSQWVSILKVCRSEKIQAIHAHWLIPQAALALAANVFSKTKIPVMCTSHGGDLYGLNDKLSLLIKKYVIRNVESLAVVSKAMQSVVRELNPNATTPLLLPMGTELTERFIPDPGVRRAQNRLLFVGRLVEKKGLRYLLDAMPSIVEVVPDITLEIVGTGPEYSALVNQTKELKLSEHVSFLGSMHHENLAEIYRRATIAIFPFIQAGDGDIEGLGLVMIEAMGCECPVIASDIPAVKDVLQDRQTGRLVKPKCSLSIANVVCEQLASLEKRTDMATRARESVVNNFSSKKQGGFYADAIDAMLV